MIVKLFLASALLLVALADSDQEPLIGTPYYSRGGSLYRFHFTPTPSTSPSQSHDLERLLELAQDHDLDVWQVAASHVDIYTAPSAPPLPPIFLDFNISDKRFVAPMPGYTPLITRTDWNLSSLANSTYHSAYHPLFEIDEFIHDVAALHPDLVKVVYLGHSGEGREMLGMTISQSLGKDKKSKMGVVINGAQHAREWIATSTALYIMHALVSDASEPHSLSHLLDTFDFHIIPAPNPDGYDYTWESDRFWYKNRMVMGPNAKCVGLDMNRNWGFKWKPTALRSAKRRHGPVDPCSHWYPGHRAFEAPEVNNLANFVTPLPNLKVFIDLRSYGQMLSSPFSYSCTRVPKDAEDQIEAAMGATRALKSAHGTPFVTGNLCNMLYQAPGNIVDWMYARAGIKYAYVAHLRDTGTFGFAIPPAWIRPVGEETANMVEYLAQFIIRNQK